MFSRKLGIDLGTVNVTIAEREQILLHEQAVVAITVAEERIVAIGQEAREMFGRTPETIEVMRPMRDGVIADYEVTEAMLRYFVDKVMGGVRLFKPTIMITVPYGVTSVERRAVHEAAIQAGAREARLIPEPLAAAIGAGLPADTPTGNMIVNLGGGTSEAAVVAMNGIVTAASERIGGARLDEAIANYIRKKYNLVIGDITAELAKINIGAATDVAQHIGDHRGNSGATIHDRGRRQARVGKNTARTLIRYHRPRDGSYRWCSSSERDRSLHHKRDKRTRLPGR